MKIGAAGHPRSSLLGLEEGTRFMLPLERNGYNVSYRSWRVAFLRRFTTWVTRSAVPIQSQG